MSEVVKNLSQKRYDELRRNVIIDAIDIVFNTISNQVKIDNKDKSFTVRKLTNSIELIYDLSSQENNDKIPSEIIKSIKPRISHKLNNTFCYKLPSKNENTNLGKESKNSSIVFSPFIQNAIEVSQNDIKMDVQLPKSLEHYHFFVFPLNMDGKEYIITYAEENKYSKREIIEILHNNVSIDKNILSKELKEKYYFN
ncbi:hypothetical protein H8356DRAFT_1384358 [Neocallimastix lanati (nom. inval.)]|nr:hypothetical protein H8356DRAFT_1758081 [Neocallimastix sp. JGI-2020a]KAG4082457.1 hypothetical protein H8356DRAFT_1753366 [Neocallimastix sp. JGI-2020a]KAG4082754.1 hypothetical protein H8356DRAFT_1384358 [Neocallimastix sp. JGI-2020a]